MVRACDTSTLVAEAGGSRVYDSEQLQGQLGLQQDQSGLLHRILSQDINKIGLSAVARVFNPGTWKEGEVGGSVNSRPV